MKKMMEKIFILTQYSLPEYKRNMNAYQRIYYGADYAQINLLIRKKQSISREIEDRVVLHRAPFEHRGLFFIYAVFLAIILRLQGCRIIITEPSGYAGVGFLAKYLAGYFWVLDVWDTPRRRPGLPIRLSDRLVFKIMIFADLFVFSILPEAAPMLNVNHNKLLQLYNAIDLSYMARNIPCRPISNNHLNVGYIRSIYTEDMGLQVLIKAAEKLAAWKCPVSIHLVGNLPVNIIKYIYSSTAANIIKIHGFIPFGPNERADFYQNIHVGVVPFISCENLNYTFPIKVLEHLSQGNPVIASNLPGIRTMIIHEYNGFLVKPGDAEELAEAIQRAQKDRELWKKMAWNALESVKRYDAAVKNQTIFKEIFHRASVNE